LEADPHLQLVAQCDSAEAKEGLCLLIRDICNGVFGGHTQQRLLASVLTPISKPGGGVRPIAMGEVMVKLAAHYLMSLIEDYFHSSLAFSTASSVQVDLRVQLSLSGPRFMSHNVITLTPLHSRLTARMHSMPRPELNYGIPC